MSNKFLSALETKLEQSNILGVCLILGIVIIFLLFLLFIYVLSLLVIYNRLALLILRSNISALSTAEPNHIILHKFRYSWRLGVQLVPILYDCFEKKEKVSRATSKTIEDIDNKEVFP